MKFLAVLFYILILYGSLMVGMYIKFSDTEAAMLQNENMFNDK